jgi:hypothetical protein
LQNASGKLTMAKKNEDSFSGFVSISDAARIRGVSHAAIQDLIKRGKLSPVEVGGRRFLRRIEVEGFQPEPNAGRPPKSSKKNGAKKGSKK